jgi:hypothetical protein
MNVSAPTPPPAPAPVNAGQSALDYINSMADPALQQRLLDVEQQFRPQYNQLNLQDINQYLLGGTSKTFDANAFLSANPDIVNNYNSDPGYRQMYGSLESYAKAAARANGTYDQFTAPVSQPGALDLLGTATQRAGEIQAAANTQQRAADIADVAKLGPEAAAAFKAANPDLYAALESAKSAGAGSNAYAQLEQALGSQQQFGNVGVNQVGQGLLGEQLYKQALGAGGLGSVGQALQGRAQTLAQSTGALTPEEIRSGQQAIRAAYTARGTEMGSGAVSAEALGRLANERQRMMEDLQMASALNQAGQAELTSNRGFQTGVYGQELGRGFSNQGAQLQTDLANRQFQAAQQQQQFQNLGLLGQLQQSQTAADRAYQLQLLNAQAAMSFDPMQSILGRSSGSIGVGQQQQSLGAGLTGTMQGPQLFDPNVGVNLALQQNANLGNYQSATYGAQAAASGAQTGGLFNALGSIGGGFLGNVGLFS